MNTITGNNLIAAITGGAFWLSPLARTVSGTSKLQASPVSIMAYYIINELAEMDKLDTYLIDFEASLPK